MPPGDGAEGTEGFTLVEVLVTLALVSVLAATMTLFASQFRSLLGAEARLEDRLSAQRVVGHLARLIEDVENPTPAEGDARPRPALSGRERELRFLAFARRGATVSGLREVRFRLSGPLEDWTLIQDYLPRRAAGTADPEPEALESVELAYGVRALSFSYLSADDTSPEPEWRDGWEDAGRLPAAVAISLTIGEGQDAVTVDDIARLVPR